MQFSGENEIKFIFETIPVNLTYPLFLSSIISNRVFIDVTNCLGNPSKAAEVDAILRLC